mmetsp:Transcript_7786/g.17856  ORF Transcript_7786/g.17856 Transcript_7786/m.17856 type:complete len:399 (+) Transcript_7786:927-2123(+)
MGRLVVCCAPSQRGDGRFLEHVQVLEVIEGCHDVLHDILTREVGAPACQPRVKERLVHRGALVRLLTHKLSKQRLGILGDLLPDGVVETARLPPDLVQKFILRLPIERVLPGEKNVHDHTGAPSVALLVVLHWRGDQLRGYTVGRAGCPAHLGPLLERATQAEVDQLDLFPPEGLVTLGVLQLRPEHDILGLQVAENEVGPVQVGEGGEDLPHNARSVDFRELRLPAESLQKSPAGEQFHDEVNVLSVLIALICLTNVRMVELPDNIKLLLHLLRILDLLLGDRLDSAVAVVPQIPTLVHNTEAPGPELLEYLKVVDELALLHLCERGPIKALQVGIKLLGQAPARPTVDSGTARDALAYADGAGDRLRQPHPRAIAGIGACGPGAEAPRGFTRTCRA